MKNYFKENGIALLAAFFIVATMFCLVGLFFVAGWEAYLSAFLLAIVAGCSIVLVLMKATE